MYYGKLCDRVDTPVDHSVWNAVTVLCTEACMYPRYEDMKSSPSTFRTQQVYKITTTSLYIPCHFDKVYVIMSRYGIPTFIR
jgi:hypothetical protein